MMKQCNRQPIFQEHVALSDILLLIRRSRPWMNKNKGLEGLHTFEFASSSFDLVYII
jgi:hypothetical protein